ncbi:hypothetical protein DFJ73DRAFT_32921 [Zopfochytrium polystomum]|nr:hypothetical protein DFJ73DRAFT_32921 [Zopfochytrium polystomum]
MPPAPPQPLAPAPQVPTHAEKARPPVPLPPIPPPLPPHLTAPGAAVTAAAAQAPTPQVASSKGKRGIFVFNKLPSAAASGDPLKVWLDLRLGTSVAADDPVILEVVGIARAAWVVRPDSQFASEADRLAGTNRVVESEVEFWSEGAKLADAQTFEKGDHSYFRNIPLDPRLVPTISFKNPDTGEEFGVRYIVRAKFPSRDDPIELEKPITILPLELDASVLPPLKVNDTSPQGVRYSLRSRRGQWSPNSPATVFYTLSAPESSDVSVFILELVQRLALPGPINVEQRVGLERTVATYTLPGCRAGQHADYTLKLALPPILAPSMVIGSIDVSYEIRPIALIPPRVPNMPAIPEVLAPFQVAILPAVQSINIPQGYDDEDESVQAGATPRKVLTLNPTLPHAHSASYPSLPTVSPVNALYSSSASSAFAGFQFQGQSLGARDATYAFGQFAPTPLNWASSLGPAISPGVIQGVPNVSAMHGAAPAVHFPSSYSPLVPGSVISQDSYPPLHPNANLVPPRPVDRRGSAASLNQSSNEPPQQPVWARPAAPTNGEAPEEANARTLRDKEEFERGLRAEADRIRKQSEAHRAIGPWQELGVLPDSRKGSHQDDFPPPFTHPHAAPMNETEIQRQATAALRNLEQEKEALQLARKLQETQLELELLRRSEAHAAEKAAAILELEQRKALAERRYLQQQREAEQEKMRLQAELLELKQRADNDRLRQELEELKRKAAAAASASSPIGVASVQSTLTTPSGNAKAPPPIQSSAVSPSQPTAQQQPNLKENSAATTPQTSRSFLSAITSVYAAAVSGLPASLGGTNSQNANASSTTASAAVKSHQPGPHGKALPTPPPAPQPLTEDSIRRIYMRALEGYRNQLLHFVAERGMPMSARQIQVIRDRELQQVQEKIQKSPKVSNILEALKVGSGFVSIS